MHLNESWYLYYYPQACVQCNNNPNADSFTAANCETVGTDGPGVSDTDFLLYVTAMNIESCATGSNRESPSTIAFAAACAMEAEFDRYTN